MASATLFGGGIAAQAINRLIRLDHGTADRAEASSVGVKNLLKNTAIGNKISTWLLCREAIVRYRIAFMLYKKIYIYCIVITC